MNKSLNIREAKKTDAVVLAALSGELGYPATTAEMENRFDKLSAKSDNSIYVAELDSIVGWIHVSVIQSLESDPFVEICGLVVAESHRGTGIGTRLVAMAESWAQENGYNHIRVRTNVIREETRRFYRKVGFQSKKTQEVFDKIIHIGGFSLKKKKQCPH
jgi:GNAT superfamily N-acetyltransferase